jgi:class 3 adenylate cyclase/tetratricopeptide (TPR) repeat protein
MGATCASCQRPLPPSAKFCPGCGRPTRDDVAEERRVASPPAAADGERKQVTVLFADLKGSMELIAHRDPEDARKILDPVLEVMIEAVHEYEGTVNQVMGDGIMALFGAPLAHEGHAVRACYAALLMQERVRRSAAELRRSRGVTVAIRIGLNSGEVVVRTIGGDLRMDYTAVGQPTHVAARMEQMAEPGTILAAAETIRLAEGYVESSRVGQVHVKGLETPVDVYAVTGAGRIRTSLQAAAARGLTPFIGRTVELMQLDAALAAAAEGRGQVVGVVGEPGVGKSRLFHEFTTSRAGDGWLVLHTGASSYGKTTAYGPVIDLLRSYFGLRDEQTDVEAVVRARLAALDPELLAIAAALLELLQSGGAASEQWRLLDRRQRRHETLEAVRRLVLRETMAQPVCLVFEDLHWIDSETHAVLDGLVEQLPAARLLLLCNYRPEFEHGWGSKTYYTRLRIDPLGADSAHAVLSALLGDRDELTPLKGLLIERTDGNPFFLEESVRTLVENGVLGGERGRHHLARPVDISEIPPTVQAVLAARIDRLGAQDKRLVQCASVIGEHVPVALLQAITDVPADELPAGLARLRSREFLYQHRFFPEPEYLFKHGLTRQVAYNSLLHGRRRALHAHIVEYVERHHRDRLNDHVEQLAHHARHGALWERAIRYLRQAGAKAFAHSANREAVSWFEQALDVAQHLPPTREMQTEAIDAHLGLRNALTLLGEHERTLQHLERAQALAEQIGHRARLGRVLSFKANALFLLARHREAIEAGRAAYAVSDELEDLPLRTATQLYVGRAQLFLGAFGDAIATLERVVAVVAGERLRDHLGLPILPSAFARSLLVEPLVAIGRFDDSRRYAEEAVALAEASTHPDTLLWAYHGAGFHHLAAGDVPAATTALERAYGLCRTYDMPTYAPRVGAELALALALGGRTTEALPMAEGAANQVDARKQAASYSEVLLLLGEVRLLAGRLPDAEQAAASALQQFRAQGERAHEAAALRLLADIASRRSPVDATRAAELYRAARGVGDELGMIPLVRRCDAALEGLGRSGFVPPPAG